SAGANHSFVRDANGTYHTLDDPFAVNGTFAYDVNASGPVVGFYYDAGNKTHGFIATPNGGGTYAFTTLDDPVATTGTTAYVPLKGLSECLKPIQTGFPWHRRGGDRIGMVDKRFEYLRFSYLFPMMFGQRDSRRRTATCCRSSSVLAMCPCGNEF